MPKPVCVPCRRFFRCEKNEFNWEEGAPDSSAFGMGERPKLEDFAKRPYRHRDYNEALAKWEAGWHAYKLWTGDKWKCPECGTEIIVGVPANPWAIRHEPDYAEKVKYADPQIRVNDC